MLKTPEFNRRTDLMKAFGWDLPKEMEPGVVMTSDGNLHIFIDVDQDSEYPDISGLPHCYGVCDTPEAFLEEYRGCLEADERNLVVSFMHMSKDPGNKGKGGGWRWHKWGPYVGKGTPTQEYLDDEKEFNEGIYCYHVYAH